MDFAEIRERVELEVRNFFQDRSNVISAIVLAVGLLLFGSYKGYKIYSRNIQRNAQSAFSDAMQTYNDALNQKDQKKIENSWNEVELAFKLGYEQNKNAAIAPFFLVYQSEALLKLGKKEEAFKILTIAIDKLSSNSPFYYFYQIKHALMQFDMNQEDKAVNKLDTLSKDTKNPFAELSNYYLGQYYLSKDDLKKAKEYFGLVISKDKVNEIKLPWENLAQEKIEQLG